MSKVLIIGGYGGFGAPLSRRLAGAGHDVMVAGRTLEKAKQFCGATPGCRPLSVDRNEGLAGALAAERPDIVVDASGPFQSASYAIVEQCLEANASYVDLADSREFVVGIDRYDRTAREAGLVVISGASSVPALSGAVARKLAAGLDRVTSVEIAISASSQASAGPSVAAAILGGVGQSIDMWRGQRWTKRHGWQELRRVSFDAGGGKDLGRRLVALADVPDLALLPDRITGRPAVTFRAGTESKLAVMALWLASWPVRWKWLKSLAPLQPILIRAHRLTALFGSDRSGMVVRLFGISEFRRVERRWSLVAESGHGPQIPSIPAAILVERIAAGTIPPGARDAGTLLTLEEFQPSFDTMAIACKVSEVEQPSSLYRRVMGSSFDRLAPSVQAMHEVLGDSGAKGQANVETGRHPLGRIVAWIMRFPPAGEHAVHVHFAEEAGIETWTRDFAGHCFASRMSQSGQEVVEEFGPLRFHFALAEESGQLAMQIKRWSLWGLRLPIALAPRSPAREWERNGQFHFDVPVDLPFVGRIIRYRGWLESPATLPRGPNADAALQAAGIISEEQAGPFAALAKLKGKEGE